jgi:putative glutamine amidotransferase
MQPVIAITGDQVPGVSSIINMNNADMAPNEIKNAVQAAGGLPIILPYPETPADAASIAQHYTELFDGLLLPGGPDVDPTMYGEEPIPECGGAAYMKDVFEIALIKATVAAGKPIFGICRGLQVINVALGGNLYQDLAAQNPECKIRHAQAARGDLPTHHVNATVGSQIAQLVGERAYVNSRHHQAARNIAASLQVTARADDGVVEALETRESDQILAVQWHPENMWRQSKQQAALFTNFVQRARMTSESHPQ